MGDVYAAQGLGVLAGWLADEATTTRSQVDGRQHARPSRTLVGDFSFACRPARVMGEDEFTGCGCHTGFLGSRSVVPCSPGA